MKKNKTPFWSFLIVSLLFFAFSCSGGGSGGSVSSSSSSSFPSPTPSTEEVTLTGTFSGGIHAEANWLKRAFASFTKKAHALDPSQVAKVLIFSAGTYTYKTAYVVNGKFTVSVPRSNPIGMIFVGHNNEYLGYLYLKNNIASLPMSRVKSSVATIDLGTLSSSGIVVEPSNNPLGNEIPLTDEEMRALAHFNGLFASIVKNPDIDGNGIIDFLENKKYFMQIYYAIYPGRFGDNLTPTIDNFEVRQYQIHFFSTTSNCPETVTVTGPQGSPFSSPKTLNRVQIGSYCTHQYISGYDPDLPAAGEYKVYYPNETLTFNVPDQSPILSNSILMVPTVTLNDQGKVQKVSWVYKLADGSGDSLNPESLITNILFNRTVAGKPATTIIIPSTAVTEVDLSDKDIDWNQVDLIGTCYDDIYGNLYGIWWTK